METNEDAHGIGRPLEEALTSVSSDAQADEAIAALRPWGISETTDLSAAIDNVSLPDAVRATACWAAGRLRYKPSIEGLLRVMDASVDRELLFEAAKAISEIGGPTVPDEMLTLLRRRDYGPARAAAVWALGSLDARQAADELGALLVDTAADVELRAAAEAIGRLNAREQGPRLLSCLRDPSPDVRLSVAYALGMIEFSPALEALVTVALSDTGVSSSGRPVADEARWAVSQIRGASD